MPLTGKAKADYQAKLMAERRAKAKAETGSSQTNGDSEPKRPKLGSIGDKAWDGKPYRNKDGELVIEPGSYDRGHEHYWGHVSKAADGTRICLEFDYYNNGAPIGGCREVRQWEGKFLNDKTDGMPSWPILIRDSKNSVEIQKKMPVTKTREQR